MKTCVVNAFSGCGKTYLYKHQKEIIFELPNCKRTLKIKDSDSSQYSKEPGWEIKKERGNKQHH